MEQNLTQRINYSEVPRGIETHFPSLQARVFAAGQHSSMCIYLRGHERACVCVCETTLTGYFGPCVLLRGDVGGEGVFCVWIQYSSKTVPLELCRGSGSVHSGLALISGERVRPQGSPAPSTLSISPGVLR